MSQQQIVVGGSWVDLLQQAQRMAQQFNDNAIPAFLKIIDGLSRLPQAQLQRGDFLLAGLRSDAAVALEAYLCSRGRVADALAVVQRGLTWPMHPDDLNAWEVRALQMHLLLKQTDAASAIVHRRIGEGYDAVALLSELAELQIWFGLPAEAEQTIGELERAVNRNQDPATMRQTRATLAWTRTRLSLQQRKWNDALAWYEHCCTLEATFREHGHVLYEPMVRGGQAELALPLIDGERKQPMRAALWRGLAQKVLGQTEQAQATWLRAAKTSLTGQKGNPGFVEWTHCFFYQGDPKGEALAMLLTAQREEANLPWSIHLATALGSALRNNMDAAHLQMKLATRALRINLDGLLFPAQSRYHFDNLLSTEQMAELQPYFFQ